MSTQSPSMPPPPPPRARVLYVDDEDDVREVFAAVFEGELDVTCASSGPAALEVLTKATFDVLVSDMRMAPMKGNELLARAYESYRDMQRILLTGYSDHEALADAVNRGHVFAYVQKPWDKEQLGLTIRRAFEQRVLEIENRRLLSELKSKNAVLERDVDAATRQVVRPTLAVFSQAMAKVVEQVAAVAGTDASVLLHGETGVGKELVAAQIHEMSPRKRGRFVAQNLAALPPELMASELFGHVKGAFTGAQQSRRGLFELADGGTLFLDEIGEAPLPLQALLLRALESREFWPVGGSEPRHVDVRIVAATNRDLLAEAKAGSFRMDLYYRLAVCPIEVPPLRARPEDVRGIGASLLESAARRMGRASPDLAENAWNALERHAWPGNVRELGNVMERLTIYHAGKLVQEQDLALPDELVSAPRLFSGVPSSSQTRSVPPASSSTTRASVPPPDAGVKGTISLDVPEGGTTFDDLEREILVQVLSRADGNQSRAARSLGLSESTFRSRLKRLGLKG